MAGSQFTDSFSCSARHMGWVYVYSELICPLLCHIARQPLLHQSAAPRKDRV